jgi:lauroyl/myristoyl acyltransferase
MGHLRRNAAANLNLVYGDTLSPKEKKSISIASFRNFALMSLDILWFDYKTEERLDKYFKSDKSFSDIFDGTPNLIITGHFCNWEVSSLACGRNGNPLTSIALPAKNIFIEKEWAKIRAKTGSGTVTRKGGVRGIMKAIKNGRSTAFLLDQDTLPEDGGIFVPFFGLPVPVSNLTGVLWLRTNAKLAMSWCIPDKNGRYTAYAKEITEFDRSKTKKEEITARITLELEDIVRNHPEYWLWCYRRWRYFRAEDPQEKYPFYAESYEDHQNYTKLIREYRSAEGPAKEAARQAVAAAAAARKQQLQNRNPR